MLDLKRFVGKYSPLYEIMLCQDPGEKTVTFIQYLTKKRIKMQKYSF